MKPSETMPYSDNFYSALDDESDIEAIGDASPRSRVQGLGVTPRHSQISAGAGSVSAHVHYDAAGSGGAVDIEDPHVYSPTDGYFTTTSHVPSAAAVPASSNIPRVPDILVEDPSLAQDATDSKAREAEPERLHNHHRNPPTPAAYQAASPTGVSSAHTTAPTQPRPITAAQSITAAYHTSSASSSHPAPAATVPPASYASYSTRSSADYQGAPFPFIPPGEAPPAYTPSPTSSSTRSQGFAGNSGNYRTFSETTESTLEMGQQGETRPLLGRRPETMRDSGVGGMRDEVSTWGDRLGRSWRRERWGCWKVMFGAVVLLMVAGGLVTRLVSGTKESRSDNPLIGEPQPEPSHPNMRYPELDDGFSWDPAQLCRDAQIPRETRTFAADFGDDKQLVFREQTADEDGRRGWGEVHVQGTIVIRRAGPGTPHSAVTLEVASTDERLTVQSSWDAAAGTLKFAVPHRVEWNPDRPRACVHVKITAWVPAGSTLARLAADAVHLDIKLLDNLSLSVGDGGTKLSSTAGTITSASTGAAARDDELIDAATPTPASFRFHSPIIDARTTASPITGAWPLLNHLSLESTAGSIRVAIAPQHADDAPPSPATLRLRTLSGAISFREPIHAADAALRIGGALADGRAAARAAERLLPPRDYRVDVRTTSGDITGAAAFGSAAAFKSTSGTISLDLLPVLDRGLLAGGDGNAGNGRRRKADQQREVALSTTSTSGATDVRVLEPLWVDSAAVRDGGRARAGYVRLGGSGGTRGETNPPLRCLFSTHTSTSADIKLRYPASWEGDISLSSLTGVLQVGGDDVKLIKAGSDWPGINKTVLARKGEKGVGGKVTGKSTSGDVNIWVGKE